MSRRAAALWIGMGLALGAAVVLRRAAGYVVPIPGAPITSGFGYRTHPVTGEYKLHAGIDFGAREGVAVRAAQRGTVSTAIRDHAVAGNYLVITHGDGRKTRYLHLSEFASGITRGAKVARGGIIGKVGATGRVTGPHLHFEVEVAGRAIDPRLLVG